jgi:hypothetical protein
MTTRRVVMDRSACPATRHGTAGALRHGCTCPDARADNARRCKQRRVLGNQDVFQSPVGTTRRLQALSSIGWPQSVLAARLGTDQAFVSYLQRGVGRSVTRATAAKVAAVFDALSMTPGPSQSSRMRSASKGWAPPLAWDDEAIDDPAASPVTWLPSTPVDRRAEFAWLVEGGETVERAARRVGVSLKTLDRERFAGRRAS